MRPEDVEHCEAAHITMPNTEGCQQKSGERKRFWSAMEEAFSKKEG